MFGNELSDRVQNNMEDMDLEHAGFVARPQNGGRHVPLPGIK